MFWFILFLIAALTAVITIQPLRRWLLSDRVLLQLDRVLPDISKTEQEAIDAGTVWWDADLFQGRPDWQKLLSVPKAVLSPKEQKFLDGPVEKLCRMLDDWKITHDDKDLSAEVWTFLRQHKFFALNIPVQYGGLGFSPLANSEVVMKVCSRSGTAGVTVMVPNSLGPAELLLHYGTEKQKQYYLPRLASGEEIPCFALTGPYAGSDAGSIPDIGRVVEKKRGNKTIIGFEVSFDKRYITLAPVATLIGLAFRAWDPDGLLGEVEEPGITCALVPASTRGVRIGRRHIPMDSAFQNGPIQGKNVFIPLQWVIGGRSGVGAGWRMLMESLATGRAISLPASAVSGAKVCLQTSTAYAQIREQFGLPIASFEGVEQALARIAGQTYMMEASRLLVLSALQLGEKPSVISAMVKYQLTEKIRDVINAAMDIHGGRGICLGPANYLGRIHQQVPIAITVEGANILTRCLIIFGQGMMRCHPFLLQETRAALTFNGSEDQYNNFDRLLHQHLLYILGNLSRSLLHGLSAALFIKTPFSGAMARYARQLSRLSAAFALLADVSALSLGASIKRRENLSGRFADALCNLFMGSAVLKHFHDNGQTDEELPLAQWACASACFEIQQALDGILGNLPNRPLSWLLRFLLFPLGRHHRLPGDRLHKQIVSNLRKYPELRLRQCQGIYLSKSAGDITGCLESALQLVQDTESIRRLLRQQEESPKTGQSRQAWLDELLSRQVLTAQQHKQMQDYLRKVHRAISVDDFASV